METFLASNPDASAQQVLDELRMVSTFSALPVEERMFLFVRAAFGPDCAKANAVGKHKAVLKGLILSVDEAAYQRRLIGVMEHLCAVAYPDLGACVVVVVFGCVRVCLFVLPEIGAPVSIDWDGGLAAFLTDCLTDRTHIYVHIQQIYE